MIVAALLLLAPPLVRPPVVVLPPLPVSQLAFDIGDRRYAMPLPAGYCTARKLPAVYTEDETSEAGIVLSKLAFVFLCQTIGKGPNDQDFVYLKYLKNYDPPMQSRSEYLTALARKMGSVEYVRDQESREFTEGVESKTEADTGDAIEAEISVMPLGHDDLCVYTGRVMKVGSTRDETASIRTATCTTLINGKVVTVDIAARMARGVGFDELRRTLRNVVVSIEPVNP